MIFTDSESTVCLIGEDKKLSIYDNRKSWFANKKSILPFLIGIIIGICFSDSLIAPQNLFSFGRAERYKRDDFRSPSINTNSSITNVLNISNEFGLVRRNTTIADKLYSEVKILCWIMTNSTNHISKAKEVKKTWGSRCNQLIFMSDEEDDELGSIDLNVGYGRDVLWGKTKEAFRYIYNNSLNEADWFLKADDDTYVILENLRYFLHSYKPENPIYFGCKFKPYVTQGYMSGGAGYVLSREAVKRFIEIGLPDGNKCRQDNGGAEDLEIGKCLENVGVIAGDSRDSLGRRTFFPIGPDAFDINLYPAAIDFWMLNYSYYNISDGVECCSNYPISFHYVKPEQMTYLYYIFYNIKVFGVST